MISPPLKPELRSSQIFQAIFQRNTLQKQLWKWYSSVGPANPILQPNAWKVHHRVPGKYHFFSMRPIMSLPLLLLSITKCYIALQIFCYSLVCSGKHQLLVFLQAVIKKSGTKVVVATSSSHCCCSCKTPNRNTAWSWAWTSPKLSRGARA